MKPEFVFPFLVGLCLMAISASGKAFLDVAVLKTENEFIKKALNDMHEDIRDIKSHLITE